MLRTFSSLAATLIVALPLEAQQDTARTDTTRLAPVVTRSTRSSQETFGSPLAITHVGRGSFASKAGFGLNDALSLVPGVLVQSRYGTSDVRIAIRGFGARGAGDRSNAGTSRGIRVLVDGIPETEPDGRTAFDNVDLAAVEGIDVIRSNASALWGNAAGGVVNISTVPDVGRGFSLAQVQSGSFGLQRYIAQAGTPIGNGVAYATFVNTTYDGWRANSDARRVLINTGLATRVGESTQLRVHLIAANNLFHIPGPLSPAEAAATPKNANATYNTRDERRYNRLGRLGASVEHQFSDNAGLSGVVYIQPKYLQRSERGTFRDFTRYHGGGNIAYNRRDNLTPSLGNRLTVGIDQAYQDGAILFYGLTAAGKRATDLRDNKKEGAYNAGVFLENELTVNDRLGVTLGVRGDAISYYNKNFINPKIDASRKFSAVTPKIGASWKFSPTHMIYANLGGGVEAPAGNETDPAGTFGQDTVSSINPLLEPIRSATYEVGTKRLITVGSGDGLLRAVSYDAALYLTNVTNEIVPYRGGRFYFTAGRARRTGAELGISAETKGGFRLDNSLTLANNEYRDYVVDSVHYQRPGRTADYSGNKIVGVPDWFYASNATWSLPKAPLGLALQLGVVGTGGYFADDANTVRVPESHILSAGLRANRIVAINGGVLSGFVSVENLADRRWIGSAFLNPDIVSGQPMVYEPGLPRSVLVSFSVSRGR